MAALIYFYGKEVSKHPYPLKDDPEIIAFFNKIWSKRNIEKVVLETLSNTDLWDKNLAEISPLKYSLTKALNASAKHDKINEAYQFSNQLVMSRAIKINPQDNMIVALENLKKGEVIKIEEKQIILEEDIQLKHKFTQESLKKGDLLVMYGVKVGIANQEIPMGAALTTENMDNTFNNDISFDNIGKIQSKANPKNERYFMGYPRKDGSAGTQNIWLFFPLVFCENRNIELLKTIFEREFYPDELSEHQNFLRTLIQGKKENIRVPKTINPFPNIEVRFITHNAGCGGTRSDSTMLGKLLAGYVNNPNVVGASVLSLGCQNLQAEVFLEELKKMNKNFDKPLLIFDQQEEGKGENLIQKIIQDSLVEIKKANDIQREKIPLF